VKQPLVIDASIALAWSLDDELGGSADEVLTLVERSGALVPTLWTYEIANSLAHFVRRSRIDAERARTMVAAFARLSITPVPPEAHDWYAETSALALTFTLRLPRVQSWPRSTNGSSPLRRQRESLSNEIPSLKDEPPPLVSLANAPLWRAH